MVFREQTTAADVVALAETLKSNDKTLGLFDQASFTSDQIFDSLAGAIARRGMAPVLDLFYRSLPTEPESYEVIDKWRNTSSLPRPDVLYALLRKGNTAIKPWLRSAARAERMICAIGDNTHLGTGFLIGDDLILTAAHVLDQVDPAKVTLTFDRITFLGCVVDPGMSVGLAHDSDASKSMALQCLDVIVLRASQSIGNQKIGASNEKRSWFGLPTVLTMSVSANDVITLLHRPGASTYLVSFGNYGHATGNGNTFLYDANPQPRSSGSPVVSSQNWDVFGVHVEQLQQSPPNCKAVTSSFIREILEAEKNVTLEPPPVAISQP